MRNPRLALPAMDAVARLGHVDVDRLVPGVERFAGMRWVSTLRAMAPMVDPRAESPPESVVRMECQDAGLDFLEPQLEIFHDGRFVARVDLGNAELRLAVEYDGDEWHSSPEQQEHDRRRRAHLVEHLGWVVVVLRREHVFGAGADQLIGMIRAGVAEARLRAAARVRW